tara:strand:+ start:895 stop:1797 length:903 start_codon:yes stop_codon:yes gene_type:complete
MAYIGNRVATSGTSIKADKSAPANSLRVKSNGNIGIGVAEPSSKLHVAGTVTATAFQGDGSALTGIESLPAAIDVNGSAPANSLAIDSAGKVGIGTSSPTNKLTIDSGTAEIRSGNYLMLRPTGNTWDMRLKAVSNQLNIYSGGDLVNPIMSLLNGGNVGIGTSSPDALLEVAGAAPIVYLTDTSYATPKVSIISGENGWLTFSANTDRTVFNIGGTERMRINTDGDVLPGANGTQDFGSTSLRWANIYTSDLHLNNGIGNYTIVEGEEDLFLYNNKNGKTYKFVLAEVDPGEAPKKMEK